MNRAPLSSWSVYCTGQIAIGGPGSIHPSGKRLRSELLVSAPQVSILRLPLALAVGRFVDFWSRLPAQATQFLLI